MSGLNYDYQQNRTKIKNKGGEHHGLNVNSNSSSCSDSHYWGGST